MRMTTALALAGLLTACAASTDGLQPASPPAHASGEGLGRPAGTGATPAPRPASGHHQH